MVSRFFHSQTQQARKCRVFVMQAAIANRQAPRDSCPAQNGKRKPFRGALSIKMEQTAGESYRPIRLFRQKYTARLCPRPFSNVLNRVLGFSSLGLSGNGPAQFLPARFEAFFEPFSHGIGIGFEKPFGRFKITDKHVAQGISSQPVQCRG